MAYRPPASVTASPIGSSPRSRTENARTCAPATARPFPAATRPVRVQRTPGFGVPFASPPLRCSAGASPPSFETANVGGSLLPLAPSLAPFGCVRGDGGGIASKAAVRWSTRPVGSSALSRCQACNACRVAGPKSLRRTSSVGISRPRRPSSSCRRVTASPESPTLSRPRFTRGLPLAGNRMAPAPADRARQIGHAWRPGRGNSGHPHRGSVSPPAGPRKDQPDLHPTLPAQSCPQATPRACKSLLRPAG